MTQEDSPELKIFKGTDLEDLHSHHRLAAQKFCLKSLRYRSKRCEDNENNSFLSFKGQAEK